MEQLNNCPNCNAEIKGGVFSSNLLITQNRSKAINAFTNNKADAHCSKCSQPLFDEANTRWKKLLPELREKLDYILPLMPVVTLQTPFGWEYEIIKMVSAQTVTGTGFMSELSASWSDFLGTQSDRMNSKLKGGEDSCKNRLRLEAAESGANAVIGADIDFAELGSERGMLMVCMAGTAVKIKNLDILGQEVKEQLMEVNDVATKLKYCLKFQPVFQQ